MAARSRAERRCRPVGGRQADRAGSVAAWGDGRAGERRHGGHGRGAGRRPTRPGRRRRGATGPGPTLGVSWSDDSGAAGAGRPGRRSKPPGSGERLARARTAAARPAYAVASAARPTQRSAASATARPGSARTASWLGGTCSHDTHGAGAIVTLRRPTSGEVAHLRARSRMTRPRSGGCAMRGGRHWR